MDLRGLSHFLAVLKHGSITLAARELGLSQSGLSKSLKRLEDSLGEQLIERGRNGVSLTGYGRVLEARAASIREQMSEAEVELRGRAR
jgi:LysR family transcriptional regulator, regulator of abg operon